MTTQNSVRSALAGFLEIFTSRYSAYAGYWLFGLLDRKRDRFELDLLGSPALRWVASPTGRAGGVARALFAEQARKAGLDVSELARAVLVIRRGAASEGEVNGRRVKGFDLHFLITVTSRAGKAHELERVVFAAPAQFLK